MYIKNQIMISTILNKLHIVGRSKCKFELLDWIWTKFRIKKKYVGTNCTHKIGLHNIFIGYQLFVLSVVADTQHPFLLLFLKGECKWWSRLRILATRSCCYFEGEGEWKWPIIFTRVKNWVNLVDCVSEPLWQVVPSFSGSGEFT